MVGVRPQHAKRYRKPKVFGQIGGFFRGVGDGDFGGRYPIGHENGTNVGIVHFNRLFRTNFGYVASGRGRIGGEIQGFESGVSIRIS